MAFNELIRLGASAAGDDYEIGKSLRFNSADSATFTRTFGTPTNPDKYTWSCWLKRTKLHSSAGHFGLLGNEGWSVVRFTGDKLYWRENGKVNITTNRRFRDMSGWYHIVLLYDSSLTTEADRAQIWINGVRETSFTSASPGYPSQDTNSFINSGIAQVLGGYRTDEQFIDGYLAEIHFVDGQGLDASNFGKTNTKTGAWVPIEYKGTYGDNGYYLDFSDSSSTSALGTDSSGEGNNWTPNNFSVSAGTGNDSMLDSPTNNCCNFNTWDNGGLTISNGGLDIGGNTQDNHARANWALPASGKYYWEFTATTVTAASYQGIGIAHSTYNVDTTGFATDGSKMYTAGGGKYHDPDSGSWGDTWDDGDIVSIAVDMDAGKMWGAKNGTWQASGNPATGANPLYDNFLAYSTFNKQWHPSFHSFQNGAVGTFNFGQKAFAHDPPTGYGALSTQTIPEPTIKLPKKHFDSVLWTGNASSKAITGLEFSPNLVWVKNRSDSYHHGLFDTVRGANKVWKSSDGSAQATYTQQLMSFDSNGFTLGDNSDSGNYVNINSDDYVAWNWKEGAASGLDIVQYSGSGSAKTVAHSLGVAPEFIIVKRIDDTANGTAYLRNDRKILLNSTTGSNDDANYWNDTSPTSSVFSIGSDTDVNASGGTYIAYCFAPISGLSKIGEYTGNGSTTGTFVFTGFRPAYLMIRNVLSTGNWGCNDDKRDVSNTEYGNDASLYWNLSNAETTSSSLNVDFLCNGFRLRSANSHYNASGDTYKYMAYAAVDFKYSSAE